MHAVTFTRRLAPWAAALTLLLAGLPQTAGAQGSIEELADRIADSIKTIRNPFYRTAAFSRVRNAGTRVDINQLIDFANVKIVRGRRLQVVDRSKLSLILKEQQVQLSDFVSAQKYQELGKLLGVDLFIYGTMYGDALVLKAIDVQNSGIAWADVFPLTASPQEAAQLMHLGGGMVNSLRKDTERLRGAKIRKVSFWEFKPVEAFSMPALMDYLSVALTKEGSLTVVDRENLRLITREQSLNQEVFIDQNYAKRLGELYGVDAFIYGSVTKGADGTLVASLKMLNIFNGVIEWADLIRIDPNAASAMAGGAAASGQGGPEAPEGMVHVAEGAFVMGTNDGLKQAVPEHTVEARAFFIDVHEVSNGDYLDFVQKRKYRAPVGWRGDRPVPGSERLPVVGVTWEDARRYCRFVRKRLPSEIEWEKAARGSDGRLYPWQGSNFSPGSAITREAGRQTAVPVTEQTQDVSPFGVRHMAGNVREWTDSSFDSYAGNAIMPFRSGGQRVIRGGSWAQPHRAARTFHREGSNPNLAWQDVGFRCVKTAR